MIAFGTSGYLASNHSYGYALSAAFPISGYGAYDSSSIEIDDISNSFPFYQIVVAAGNDRNDFDLPQLSIDGGYDMLTGMANSKNSLVVAAVEEVSEYLDESSVVMSSFSNFGPTDDGRIKPDISAKGVNVFSSSSMNNLSYATLSGTSMASPAITGLVLLLQKHFNNLNPSTYMRASMVRGLICHSAREAGFNLGPDYEYGWGLANGVKAAEIISNRGVSSVLESNTLTSNQVFTKDIVINSEQNIEVSICWTDPTGVANSAGATDQRTARLINNLDLKVLFNGNIYYPYKLDPNNPSNPATNDSDNDVDNIEKVEIPNAQPGVYTIQISHKGNLRNGSQVYSLIASGSGSGVSLNTSDYEFDNSIFIYPNPASDVLNFDLKSISFDRISVNDISGKEVYLNNKVSGIESISVSNLSPGVYFVNFISGLKTITKKFIKE